MIKVLQLTDMHLYTDPQGALLGIPTQKSFQLILDHVHQSGIRPDLVLLTGDLIQDDQHSSYGILADMLQSISAPIYWISGNHDTDALELGAFHGSNIADDKLIITDEWLIVLLNSRLPGEVPGELGEDQLRHLRESLADYPEHNALVVLHHHPVDIGTGWLSKIGLKDQDAFWQEIDQFNHVKAILWGHIHQEFDQMRGDIRLLATPSTCIQFKGQQKDFGLDEQYPGYRWLYLEDDGSMTTEVIRLKDFDFKPDDSAGGY